MDNARGNDCISVAIKGCNMWEVKFVETYAVMIPDQETSRMLQEASFSVGYKWSGYAHGILNLGSPVLWFEKDGFIHHSMHVEDLQLYENHVLKTPAEMMMIFDEVPINLGITTYNITCSVGNSIDSFYRMLFQ